MAPIIEPKIIVTAGRNGILPRDQNTIAPPIAVKIVANSDVAIAFRILSLLFLEKEEIDCHRYLHGELSKS